jgi:hypothetical protein
MCDPCITLRCNAFLLYWCGALLINNSSDRRIRKKGLCFISPNSTVHTGDPDHGLRALLAQNSKKAAQKMVCPTSLPFTGKRYYLIAANPSPYVLSV